MNPRVDITKHISSAPVRALFNLSAETQKRIDPALFHLIEIRASQINGCAYCIDMHTKDARAMGESEQRIQTLAPGLMAFFFPSLSAEAATRVALPELLGLSIQPKEVALVGSCIAVFGDFAAAP